MVTRREVMAAALATSIAAPAWAQPAGKLRLSWPSFRASGDYPAYVAAIGRMRANPDRTDAASWLYWADVHEAHCPHGLPYFLAWHRGLLHLFERKLAEVSGIADFRLPYWDYYSSPALPAEFVQGGGGDPLWADRVGRSVAAALTLEPFDAAHLHFQQGLAESFEVAIESQPHNPVHNLIGGVMVTMQSPQDPIFWVHHANVDRLWTAWVAAGQGRTMPPEGAAYWSGDFTYAPGMILARDLTRDGRAAFGDIYENSSLPRLIPFVTAAPPPLRAGRAGAREQARTQAQARAAAPPPYAPRPLALAPGASLALGSQSFSVAAPVLAAPPPRRSGGVPQAMAAAPPPRAAMAQARRDAQLQTSGRSVTVILDGVALTELGKRGGYFYKVYLNLPHAAGGPESGYLLGTLGPFEIAAARHRMAGMAEMPARLEFPATDKLRRLAALDAASLVVSFVRVDGSAVAGDAITVDSFKVEATS